MATIAYQRGSHSTGEDYPQEYNRVSEESDGAEHAIKKQFMSQGTIRVKLSVSDSCQFIQGQGAGRAT